jgi:hypothetical protein
VGVDLGRCPRPKEHARPNNTFGLSDHVQVGRAATHPSDRLVVHGGALGSDVKKHRAHFALGLGLSLVIAACDQPSSSAPGSSTKATHLTGSIDETLDAPPYTYLRLKTEQGVVWAAVPVVKIDKDKRVTVLNAVTLRNVDAPAIGRRFEVVYFGTLGAEGAGAAGGN